MDANTLALGATVALALSWAIYQLGKPTPLPGIPHNKLNWFTGDIPFLARLAKEKGAITYAFDDTAMRLGPVSQVVVGLGASWASRIFGFGQAIVILADAQEMHDVLVNRATEFDRSKSISALFAGTLPQGMLALPTDDQFKHHKRYLGITMTNPYLARMMPRIVDSMQELMDLWALGSKRLPPKDSTYAIPALDDIRLATIDVIASITFGASFDGVRASSSYLEANPTAPAAARPPIPALAKDMEILLDVIGDGVLFPAPRLLPWLTRNFNRKWRRAITGMHTYLLGRLHGARADYALEDKSERPAAHKADNVLDMIMEREREDAEKGAQPLTEGEIIDELTTFALGGSETTATTMQWAVKILCKHPRVQRTLRAELQAKFPSLMTLGQAPSYAELSDEALLPYLSAVVYELLRCSRTAAAVARDATRDTVLLGHAIPKGTQVLMPIGMVQQCESEAARGVTDGLDAVRGVPGDPGSQSARKGGRKMGYWKAGDVGEFKPERWLRAREGENGEREGSFDPAAGPWLPFSFGFRGCFGQKLALIELRLFLAMTNANFFLAPVPEALNGWAAHETVTNHPLQCYIRPVGWESEEAQR
ncbi:cytochrome P450 [Mycena crocata]|nr:cytochrome P450 [Mycena crocata]